MKEEEMKETKIEGIKRWAENDRWHKMWRNQRNDEMRLKEMKWEEKRWHEKTWENYKTYTRMKRLTEVKRWQCRDKMRRK